MTKKIDTAGKAFKITLPAGRVIASESGRVMPEKSVATSELSQAKTGGKSYTFHGDGKITIGGDPSRKG